ncbi:MAG: methanogenesis marker 3 protein [Candidatus Verstraetearchaeota archaeon]|nr:methanogenesis marker 3 protein [Candidatus Verstraetearchaeota archaeon]
MKIAIDGEEFEAENGESLGSILSKAGLGATDGRLIAVRRKVSEESIETDLFEFQTTQGRMIIKVDCKVLLEVWKKAYHGFEGSGVRWVTKDAVVFGPSFFDAEPSLEPVTLARTEVTISLSGLSRENAHLVFSKRPHLASYYPPRGCAALGRVVYGRHLIGSLKMGDKILSVKPVLEVRERTKSLLRGEPGMILEESDKIFTRVELSLEYDSPVCGEHAYNMLDQGIIKVTSDASSYICSNELKVTSLVAEKMGERRRGTVTVRNSGENVGGLYIYKKDVPLAQSHTIVGKVLSGMELVDLAEEGDVLSVLPRPKRIRILGKSFSEAQELLRELNIKVLLEGDEREGIIVEHMPQNTLEIYKKREVVCKTTSPEKILKVRLYYEDAPRSVKYFRAVTGLERKTYGKLRVYFSNPKMEMVLFRGDGGIAKGLTPENVPTERVRSGQIGLTNTVKKFVGMIGVRLTDSDRFGPTAEGFDGTNLIGEVVGGLTLLKGVKEGDEIYLQEVGAR